MSPEQSLSHLQTYCIRKCGRGQFQRLILDTNFSAVQSFILEEIRRDLNYRQPGSKRGCGQCFFLHNSQVMLRLRSGYSQVILRLFSGYSQVSLRLFSGYSQVFLGFSLAANDDDDDLRLLFCPFSALTSFFLSLFFLPMPTPTTTQSVLRYFHATAVVKNKFISSIFLSAEADTDDDALGILFLVFFRNCRCRKRLISF